MKKTPWICGILLCTLLTGCRANEAPSTDFLETEEESEQRLPVEGENTEDARLSYYEQLVSALQEELLTLKAEIYIDRVEYESRIAELENAPDAPAPEQPQTPPSEDGAVSREEQFRYRIENGEVTLTAYVGKETTVTVPSTIEGCPVVALGDRTFMDNTILTEVTLPSGIRHVGWFAFSGCVALENVSIPASVETIAYGAFQNCQSALTVTCDAGSYAEAYARSYGIGTKRNR